MSLTADQQAIRRTGISGSDAAGILGVSPWTDPAGVWLSKVYPEAVSDEKFAQERPWLEAGARLEPVIAKWFADETGIQLVKGRTIKDAENNWLCATPDYLARNRTCGVECKNLSPWGTDGWGKTGSSEVPLHYYMQCSHYMMVFDVDVWHVAALFGGCEFRRFTLQRDLDFEKDLFQQESAFWHNYVEPKIEPPSNSESKQYTDYLKKRFPKNLSTNMLPADTEYIQSLMVVLAETYAEMKDNTKMFEGLKNKAKKIIGTASGIEYPEKKISVTWNANAVSYYTDIEGAMNEFATAAKMPPDSPKYKKVLAKYRKEKDPVRTFLVKDKSDKE